MREVVEGVWQFNYLLPNIINLYVLRTTIGDVLIDGGTRWCTGRLLRQLRGRKLAMVALTHAHPDHQGAVAEVCRRFRVPLACHEADADFMEGKVPIQPQTPLVRIFHRLWSGPPYPVEIRWKGGEMLGEWKVIHTPGHTKGHVIFHRASDDVVIVGDVVRNASLRGGVGRMSETPHFVSVDWRENRQSMRTVLNLRPKTILFGHGPVSTRIEELESLLVRLEHRS
jgi:glyoxylase-like metal-dependent hydrolase (beta-lactamase superfamily II)